MPSLILLFLFIVIPIIEISVLIKVGSAIGLGNTLLFIIATAILGAYLVKQQGIRTISKLQHELASGQLPALRVAEGFAILLAGALLLTPGFVTDAFGFACLIPPIRQAGIKYLVRSGIFKTTQFTTQSPTNAQTKDTHIIDGEYSERD